MATQVQIRRGTSSQVAAFTGAEGEIVVNTTNDSLHIHDGSSAGGFEMARADLNNVSDTDLNAALTGNTVSALTVTALTSSGIEISGAVTATASDTNPAIFASTSGSNFTDLFLRHASSSFTNAVRLRAVSDGLAIFTSDVQERIRVLSTGLVGIGTSSPATLLELSANNNGAASNNTLRFTDTDTTTQANQQIGKIEFFSKDSSGDGALVRGFINCFSEDATPSAAISFATNPGGVGNTTEERMRIDSSGNVNVGDTTYGANLGQVRIINDAASTPASLSLFGYNNVTDNTEFAKLEFALQQSGTGGQVHAKISGLASGTSENKAQIAFYTSDGSLTERMRIDSSGNLLVGTTQHRPAEFTHPDGFEVRADVKGQIQNTVTNAQCAIFNRDGSDGEILLFRKEGASVGSIASYASAVIGINLRVTTNKSGFRGAASSIIPWYEGADRDNELDVGNASVRWDDIYATNGTIQTSDRNEKQDIAELSDAEQRVAVAAKGLLRKFRWIDAVEAKGDDARIHFGIIAQDLQDAFTAEGLDAGRYAMFINSTWTDEETGEERSRMGVRYSELLAFIISAI